MNRTLLLKVKEQILKEPERFIMAIWVADSAQQVYVDHGLKHDVGSCGTAACIGGWTCLIAQQEQDLNSRQKELIKWSNYRSAATLLLGFDESEKSERDLHSLFSVTAWPRDLAIRWYDARDVQERAEIAAERIDRFIAEHCQLNKAA